MGRRVARSFAKWKPATVPPTAALSSRFPCVVILRLPVFHGKKLHGFSRRSICPSYESIDRVELIVAVVAAAVVNEEFVHKISAQRDAFFRRLLVSDPVVQKKMTTLIVQELREMLENDVEFGEKSIGSYYPTVVRLARKSPFQTMREAFMQLVEEVEEKIPAYSVLREKRHRVSYFVDNSQVEHLENNEDEELQVLFQRSFLMTGRVSHLIQLLAWHKSYLSLYQDSVSSIMLRDGPLPLPWRSYIGAMAASELRCHYLADTQQYYFLVNGGEPEWIKGIDYVAPKLFRLHEISSLLAHRPWLITADHIAELLASDQDDSWSVSELVHAIIVLCKYHSMCSISLGLGCAEEEDLTVFSEYGYAVGGADMGLESPRFPYGMSAKDAVPQMDNASSCGSMVEQDLSTIERDETILLKRLKNGHEGSETADDDDDEDDGEQDLGDDNEQDGDDQGVEEAGFDVVEDGLDYNFHVSGASRRKDSLWRFCGGSVIRYADFDVRSEEYKVLHTEDFSWDEHCFSLVKRYFPGEAGQILEDLFNLTSKLTYDYYGAEKEESIDTSPYRDAVWFYVHRIFGICHDDYDYRQVNIYLNRPTKIFIKKVACTPWKVRQEDFEHFDHTLSASEKAHVTLIVAEARKQAGLMYGLRAVMQHMR
ncbi:Sestrin-like protein, partial [Globisporangium splendens]